MRFSSFSLSFTSGMVASRFSLFRTSFFHFYRNAPSPTPPSSLSTTLSPRVHSFAISRPRHAKNLEFNSYSSAAAAVDQPSPDSELRWPEWVSFIDRLKTKGYFEAEGTTQSVLDENQVKSACLNFGRERFDILSSLPKEDIQAVVESGCPNLFRKAVNSAKRLRAYLRLDEGEVCGACNLRGSCDRAYLISKEDEKARTVDIVRVLLTYATDPHALSDTEKSKGREHIEESARKLLSKLIELSDTAIDPSLPKLVVETLGQTGKLKKLKDHEKKIQGVEMKRGDWICSKCNFMNFARNIRCLECKEDGPGRVGTDEAEMKKGDWTCPQCEFMNFARNTQCLRCQKMRPKRELLPGEWECPSCDYLNFRRNTACHKCNCVRPKESGNKYDDQLWRKPKVAVDSGGMDFGVDGERPDDEFPSHRSGTTRSSSRTPRR